MFPIFFEIYLMPVFHHSESEFCRIIALRSATKNQFCRLLSEISRPNLIDPNKERSKQSRKKKNKLSNFWRKSKQKLSERILSFETLVLLSIIPLRKSSDISVIFCRGKAGGCRKGSVRAARCPAVGLLGFFYCSFSNCCEQENSALRHKDFQPSELCNCNVESQYLGEFQLIKCVIERICVHGKTSIFSMRQIKSWSNISLWTSYYSSRTFLSLLGHLAILLRRPWLGWKRRSCLRIGLSFCSGSILKLKFRWSFLGVNFFFSTQRGRRWRRARTGRKDLFSSNVYFFNGSIGRGICGCCSSWVSPLVVSHILIFRSVFVVFFGDCRWRGSQESRDNISAINFVFERFWLLWLLREQFRVRIVSRTGK